MAPEYSTAEDLTRLMARHATTIVMPTPEFRTLNPYQTAHDHYLTARLATKAAASPDAKLDVDLAEHPTAASRRLYIAISSAVMARRYR